MDKNKRIELEIEKTMDCFNKKPDIETGMEFYNKIIRKIEYTEKRQFKWGDIFNLRLISATGLVMLILINIITMFRFNYNSTVISKQTLKKTVIQDYFPYYLENENNGY